MASTLLAELTANKKMRTYNPLHPVTDPAKVESMAAQIKRGESLPPIVVHHDDCVTGTHRSAAYEQANREAEADWESGEWDRADLVMPTVEVSSREWLLAMLVLDQPCECGYEHNTFCAALHAITDDDDVRAALADQTHGETVDRARVDEVRSMSREEQRERLCELGWDYCADAVSAD